MHCWSHANHASRFSTFTTVHRPVNSPVHAFTHLSSNPETICFLKLAYFVAFGPHGPRTPANEPGHSLKVVVGVVALVGAAYGVFALARSQGTFPFPSLDPYPIPFWLPVSVGTSLNWAVGLVWSDLVTC